MRVSLYTSLFYASFRLGSFYKTWILFGVGYWLVAVFSGEYSLLESTFCMFFFFFLDFSWYVFLLAVLAFFFKVRFEPSVW